jgi:hypothetical protein
VRRRRGASRDINLFSCRTALNATTDPPSPNSKIPVIIVAMTMAMMMTMVVVVVVMMMIVAWFAI